ncbi:MAG: hypothetical protein PHR83_04710 [Paludibacter sp.]|nr:hypothetical protein [Paludibacter sp.]
MKKKNKKNSIEDAVEVVNTLKATVSVSQVNDEDISVINSLETSLRKIEKLRKEVLTLKEKVRIKKADLDKEQEAMWELVRSEKKLLKSQSQKPEKADKKEKKQKAEKVTEVK